MNQQLKSVVKPGPMHPRARQCLGRQATPSFFCRLLDDVVYWNVSRLSG
jgi:hypothetical protein